MRQGEWGVTVSACVRTTRSGGRLKEEGTSRRGPKGDSTGARARSGQRR
jgi:hypothetical protein